MVRVIHILVLLYAELTSVCDRDNSAFISVGATVVWCRENSDTTGERLWTAPSVHFVAVRLHLMSSNQTHEVIF